MDDSLRGCKARMFAVTASTEGKELVAANLKRTNLIVYNNGTDTAYLLSSQGMSTDDGMPLLKGETYTNPFTKAAYWIKTASGTQNIRAEEDSD